MPFSLESGCLFNFVDDAVGLCVNGFKDSASVLSTNDNISHLNHFLSIKLFKNRWIELERQVFSPANSIISELDKGLLAAHKMDIISFSLFDNLGICIFIVLSFFLFYHINFTCQYPSVIKS